MLQIKLLTQKRLKINAGVQKYHVVDPYSAAKPISANKMYNRLVHSRSLSIRFHQQRVQQLHTHINIIMNIICIS